MAVQPIPEGYHALTPFFVVKGAPKFMEFLKKAFGAEEVFRMDSPDGTLMHAEMRIGDSRLMLSEACDKAPVQTAMHYVYVQDVDAAFRKAVAAGGTVVQEPADQFYGDRSGGLKDAYGNTWWLATHVEDVSSEELAKRAQQQRKPA